MATRDLHTPVMLERTIELLSPALQAEGAVLVDATLGMGGHAEAFLARFPGLVLVGLDRDTEALRLAGERLAPFGDRVHLVHAVYDTMRNALDSLGITGVQGILFDLGVSSLQLDRVDRGFSYSKDAPLDMRMDATSPLTAEIVLATYSESELRRIFYEYGEEKLAPRYASKIVQARELAPLTRSAQLVDIIVAATPAAVQRAGHRRSGSSRPCGSRSTPSCPCSRGPSPPRWTPSTSAVAWSCSPTSRSRTGSSSGCCSRGRRRRPPPDSPSNFPSTAPSCAFWCAERSSRARTRNRTTPGQRRFACAPSRK